jgi:hypothetical protein
MESIDLKKMFLVEFKEYILQSEEYKNAINQLDSDYKLEFEYQTVLLAISHTLKEIIINERFKDEFNELFINIALEYYYNSNVFIAKYFEEKRSVIEDLIFNDINRYLILIKQLDFKQINQEKFTNEIFHLISPFIESMPDNIRVKINADLYEYNIEAFIKYIHKFQIRMLSYIINL